jgi:uncharacterized membrane protein YsdA (DUF1294 family)
MPNLTFNPLLLAILVAYLLINLLSFSLMVFDKHRSQKDGQRRISEKDLFFWAINLGALGVLIGMQFSRHKTRKWQFSLGIPLALIQNWALIWLVLYWLRLFN